MRIAVTYEDGEIFQHSEQFKLYDVEDGKIVGEQVVDTNGSAHGALAGFLQAAKVDALICGGIGMGAQMALADAEIRLYAGVLMFPCCHYHIKLKLCRMIQNQIHGKP